MPNFKKVASLNKILPDNFLHTLEKKSAKRAKLFKDNFPSIESLISSQFQLMAELLTYLRGQIKEDFDKAIVIQGYRCFNCSWTSYQNIKAGFISEGAAVAIEALESLMYAEYFTLKPHLASRWLDGTDYPIQSFRKLLPNAEFNQKLYLLLKGYTDYGLLEVPRKLVESSQSHSFSLGGIDEIDKQFTAAKLLAQLLNMILILLYETCPSLLGASLNDFKEKLQSLESQLKDFDTR